MHIQSFFTTTIQPQQYTFHYSNDDHSSMNHQFSWMDQYFNQNVLQEKLFFSPQVSNIHEPELHAQCIPSFNQTPSLEEVVVQRKNKSVFHNFQKHLLTLLKKVIIIKKAELAQFPSGNRAYDLWKIFVGLDSYAKKNLYIIFGVAQRENERNIREAAQQIPELQRMLNKYGIDEVETAQKILRRIVSTQATQIQRQSSNANAK